MIERKILSYAITSTEFLQRIKSVWAIHYFSTPASRRIAGFIWDYFLSQGKAPKKEIETIILSKEKSIGKDIFEDLQEIIDGISEDFNEEEFDLDYAVVTAKKFFSERKLLIFKENLSLLLEQGNIEEANKAVREYSALDTQSIEIKNHILSVQQIRRLKKVPPITYLKPWLKAGQITIIYGGYGCGKTLFTIAICYMLGLENYIDIEEMGSFQVKVPTGCLYIDGELGMLEMEERVAQFEWLGYQNKDRRMQILSVPEYQLATEDSFYLGNRLNQLKIINWLKENEQYKVLVLDSVSTLFGLVEENDNSEWSNKINPFLRDLRALGVACILLHHSGKNNKKGLRGASAMGAMAHNIFRLEDHSGKNVDDGEAWFVLSKDKQRAAGVQFRKISLRFTRSIDDKETHWEETNSD